MSTYPLSEHKADVVIVGAGGAGLRAALSCLEAGLSVACLSKVPATRSHTVAAQGGINAPLGNRAPDDWRWLMYDTIRGADWLADQDAVAFLCRHAAEAVRELEHLGVVFTRDENGKIYQRAYGGQSTEYGKGDLAYRACAAADRTGHAILQTLYGRALRAGLALFEEFMVLDLLMEQGRCVGVLAWELETGALHVFRGQRVILATGGYGQVYSHTTASSICTGDGNACALRAGLALQDMEFVQFHPTGLYGCGLLITEGARGEGGWLVNAEGERFMERYAPKSMELASRDVISRAIAEEIAAGRGCGPQKDHVLLSIQHLPHVVLEEKLPTVGDIARTFARIDPAREAIPVVPTVHYTMGGIPTNACGEVIYKAEDGSEQLVPGLMALGEAACHSVHGANRLGCNSLLDLMVFGRAAGPMIREQVTPGAYHSRLASAVTEEALARFDVLRTADGDERLAAVAQDMRAVMDVSAGIFREAGIMRTGEAELDTLSQRLKLVKTRDRSLLWNTELMERIEVENLMLQAQATLHCAHIREESRGAHFRRDFPERNDAEWLHHTLVQVNAAGEMSGGTRPVVLQSDETEIPDFIPEARRY